MQWAAGAIGVIKLAYDIVETRVSRYSDLDLKSFCRSSMATSTYVGLGCAVGRDRKAYR